MPAAEPDRSTEEPSPRPWRLPGHLPREDVTVDVAVNACPHYSGELYRIGESVSEMLDFVPARFRVLRIRSPKYGCRACGTIHQAPTPERPITKGLASPGLLAMSSPASTAITPRSIANPRSLPDNASRSNARRSPTGWGHLLVAGTIAKEAHRACLRISEAVC